MKQKQTTIRAWWSQVFTAFAKRAASISGHPASFFVAVSAVLVWAVTGPFFGYSDAWQLVINTSTTIITFLLIFLLQNSQNRDIAAVQIKLDELVRAMRGARNDFIDCQELSEDEFEQIKKRMADAKHCAAETTNGRKKKTEERVYEE